MRSTACRRDEHGYGISVAIGGGLLTRTCKRCGDVELDLRGAVDPQPGLFEPRQRMSWFEVGWHETHGGLDFAAGG